MADHDHPLVAGAFLAMVIGVGGTLIVSKLLHPTRPKGEPAPRSDLESTVPEQITAAIRIGEEGDVVAAAQILAAVVRAHPENTDALFNLGVALAGLEQTEDADKIFARILELSPNDWDTIAERAGLRLAGGKIDEAFQMIDGIPRGEGRLKMRLEEDSRWEVAKNDPRLAELRIKHGLPARSSTGTVAQP